MQRFVGSATVPTKKTLNQVVLLGKRLFESLYKERGTDYGVFILMWALGRSPMTEADELNEYRMSNKEFRMMKFNFFYLLLRRSLFVVRYSAVRF